MIEVQDLVTLGSREYITLLKAEYKGINYFLLSGIEEDDVNGEFLMVYYDESKQLRAIADENLAKEVFAVFQKRLDIMNEEVEKNA